MTSEIEIKAIPHNLEFDEGVRRVTELANWARDNGMTFMGAIGFSQMSFCNMRVSNSLQAANSFLNMLQYLIDTADEAKDRASVVMYSNIKEYVVKTTGITITDTEKIEAKVNRKDLN